VHVGMEDRRAVGHRQVGHLGLLERALDVAGGDRRHLVGVHEAQPAPRLPDPQHLGPCHPLVLRVDRAEPGSGVDHDPVEHVELGDLEDVLDDPELLARVGEHGQAHADRAVGDGGLLFVAGARRVVRHVRSPPRTVRHRPRADGTANYSYRRGCRFQPRTETGMHPEINLVDADTYRRGGAPHDQFTWLRRHAPVYWHADGGAPGWPGFWAVTRHADVGHISRHPEIFSSHRRLV